MTRIAVAVAVIIVAAVVSPDRLRAQEWPAKPVRIISPFAAGGGSDTLARILATQLSEQLGRQFYVENRGGAGGLVGTAAAAKAEPDGYTLVVSSIATHVLAPASSANPGFHPLQDFTHIAFIGGPPTVIAVHPSLGVTSLRALVAAAKAAREPLSYVSPGPGTLGNLIAVSLGQAEGIALAHITYKGAGQAVTDLIAGHVKLGSVTLTAALGHIRAGTLIPLAVSSAARLGELPQVPTLKELGYPNLVATTWFAIAGPAGIPRPIVVRLNQEIVKAIRTPMVQQRFRSEEIETAEMSADALTAFVTEEIARWTPIARKQVAN
ncbi:MAG: tripartite tricarboxylate transporter substrate binding protein [Hyphomicrobiales bacterium]|nr:tripartite tricarboxylate transporter substrate binding protein [Hyphomicrobiales bacterium]